MTDLERELEESRKEIQYLFCWFRSRCAEAEIICDDIVNPYIDPATRNQFVRQIGGKLRDIEHAAVKLRQEWEKFKTLKKRVKRGKKNGRQ